MPLRLSAAVLGLLCALSLPAMAASTASATEDIARIDKILEQSAARHEFMGTVLVARKGEVLLDKGYGYANLEKKTAMSPDSRFRIGSLTKQFTAAAILLLEERGKLKLDDPISTYLPDAPAAWGKVTLVHLLTHTSGIPSYTSLPEFEQWKNKKATPLELIGHVRKLPLEFAPGADWSYDNTGYVLLGYVIEQVSGKSYAEFLQENIFGPLHLENTGYDRNDDVFSRGVRGYEPFADKPGKLKIADSVDMSEVYAAGALYSTTGDLLRWESALFGGHVLSAASLKKMTTAYKENYGFALFVKELQGHREISHGGNIEGFSAEMGYFPDDGLCVIVLSNVGGEIADTLTGRIEAIELSVKAP